MASRYRLRFLFQEFDLPRGSTIIGRSSDCHLTIEDPHVSRRHARIVTDDSGARVEDLGSRNGVRVDGTPIAGPTALADGMRMRIGSQDFLFCEVRGAPRAHDRTTGSHRLCATCHSPYPREAPTCPSCEATELDDPDTLTGVDEAQLGQAWSAKPMIESLDRALALGHVQDAARILYGTAAQLDTVIARGGVIEAASLAAITTRAAATAAASGDPSWALWAFDLCVRTGHPPSAEAVEHLAEVAPQHPAAVLGAITALLERIGGAGGASRQDAVVIARLEQLSSLLGEEGPWSPVRPSSWPQAR